MGERGRLRAMQRLAEDLRTKTSLTGIAKCLNDLCAGLKDPATGEKVAAAFLRAGGLPALIPHLGVSTMATRAQDMVGPLLIRLQAASAIGALVCPQYSALGEVWVATGVITPLIEVLREGPNMLSRGVALSSLLALANAQPEQSKAMAEAGVMGMLFTLSLHATQLPPDSGSGLVGDLPGLARRLVESDSVAARDLVGAIRSPDTVQCFGALLLLLVRFGACFFLTSSLAAQVMILQTAFLPTSLLLCAESWADRGKAVSLVTWTTFIYSFSTYCNLWGPHRS
jgi:hypothetical protein